MNLQSWILLLVVLALVVWVAAGLFRRHRQGRGGCNCCSTTTCPIKQLKKH